MNVVDNEIKELLQKYKKFCVYGLSSDTAKASHYVPLYMRNHGWEIIGSYPKKHAINNFEIYPNLSSIPIEYRKFVDVFRSSDRIPDVVDEILDAGGVEVMWLQLGITHPAAEKKAQDAGIRVVSNRCLIIEHKKYFT